MIHVIKEPEQSDTIEGLAEKLGLNPRELKKTVDEFNAASVSPRGMSLHWC